MGSYFHLKAVVVAVLLLGGLLETINCMGDNQRRKLSQSCLCRFHRAEYQAEAEEEQQEGAEGRETDLRAREGIGRHAAGAATAR